MNLIGFTVIARASDALALAADTESSSNAEMEKLKATAKNVLRKVSQTGELQPPNDRVTIDAVSYNFHLLMMGGVLFLSHSDPNAPVPVVFAYLEDIANEFLSQYGTQVDSARRPYVFIKFDLYLQKAKKSHLLRAQQSRPPPRNDIVRRSFRDVMGFGPGPSSGGGGQYPGGSHGSSNKGNRSMFVIVFSVIAVLSVCGVLAFFLMQ